MDESAATTSTGRSSVRQNSREKCKLLYACVMHLYYYHNNLCVANKRKRDGISADVLEILGELEEKADQRWLSMEEKRMKLEAELEEKRRKEERKHEMRMQHMMFSYMQQLVTPHPSPYTHQPPVFPHHSPPPPNPLQATPPPNILHTPPPSNNNTAYTPLSQTPQSYPQPSSNFYTFCNSDDEI